MVSRHPFTAKAHRRAATGGVPLLCRFASSPHTSSQFFFTNQLSQRRKRDETRTVGEATGARPGGSAHHCEGRGGVPRLLGKRAKEPLHCQRLAAGAAVYLSRFPVPRR